MVLGGRYQRAEREMNRDGRLLYQAVMSTNSETLRRLLDADRSIVKRLRRTGTISDGLMNSIVVHAVPSMIRVMLTKIPTFGSKLNSQGQCSLHLASARGHLEVVKAIVASDVNACSVRDRDGMIPLHLAAIKGQLDVLKELVRADWTTASLLTAKGDPILHLCAENKQFKALITLVDLVKSTEFVGLINFSRFVMLKDSDDNTIFHLLSAKRQPEVIEFLHEKGKGLDVNAVNKSGFTPLDVSLQEAKKGFSSLKTDWTLVRVGAKTATPIWQPMKMATAADDYLKKLPNTIKLTAGGLFFGVIYQANNNPPGGIWTKSGYHEAPQSSPPKLVYHYAGKSIMASMDPECFKYYSLLIKFSFYSILALITVLFRNRNSNYWFSKIITGILVYVSIAAVVFTFAVSNSFTSPEGRLSTNLLIAGIVTLIALLFLIIPDNFHVVMMGWFLRPNTRAELPRMEDRDFSTVQILGSQLDNV